MVIAAFFFFTSLVVLALLFTLKAIEAKRQRMFVPGLRRSADEAARSLKSYLVQARGELERVPPAVLYLGRLLLRELALHAAKLARLAEAQLHNVAEMVSHKRGFEKRRDQGSESRSEFLKQVGEAKGGLDAEKHEGQNS